MLPDTQVWLAHFEYHAQHPRRIPEGVPNVLGADERRLIAASLARLQAQKACSDEQVETPRESLTREDASALTRILELQTLEDRHHATLLQEFMTAHGMPVRSASRLHRVLSVLRSLVGPQTRVSLRLAEQLIGQVQYRALESATRCQHLRLLCRMLVADELSHAAFQSELFLATQAQSPPVSRAIGRLAHRAFFIGAACVCWHRHREVLRQAGYRLSTFVRACVTQYSFYLKTHAPVASMPA